MTRVRIHLSVYLLLICCVLPLMAQNAVSANSVVPGTVKFTGTLNDPNGKPLTGTVGVTFLLYKEQSGGAPLWMETQNVQADKNGRYSVMLGSTTSHGIPADAFAAGEARWIGVQPSGQAEQPRVELGSVPYALKAADAQTLGGLARVGVPVGCAVGEHRQHGNRGNSRVVSRKPLARPPSRRREERLKRWRSSMPTLTSPTLRSSTTGPTWASASTHRWPSWT